MVNLCCCCFFSQKWFTSNHLTVYTHSSGSLSFAAIFASHWQENTGKYPIAIKEISLFVLGNDIWCRRWKTKKVLFISDNIAVVQVINKHTLKEVTLIKLVRRLVLATLKWNVHFRAIHIPCNSAADKLSQFQLEAAFQYTLQLKPNQTLIPESLLESNYDSVIPLSFALLCNFIACLFFPGYSLNSISHHVSPISYMYVHKILSLQDPSESFLVRKIIQGCHYSAPIKDSRLTITGPFWKTC